MFKIVFNCLLHHVSKCYHILTSYSKTRLPSKYIDIIIIIIHIEFIVKVETLEIIILSQVNNK